MKFFLDSANVEDIKKYMALGLVDGITTNPSIIMKSGRKHKEVIQEIAKIVDGPISIEGVGLTTEEMVKEGEEFSKWIPNAVIKVPMTEDGLKAVKILEGKNIHVNVTLVFSLAQAILVAKAGASYVSPFVGRLDDIGEDGMTLISEIKAVYSIYGFKTEIIVASVRSVKHVNESALIGADIATIPIKVLNKMWSHELTDKGIKQFLEDHKKSKK